MFTAPPIPIDPITATAHSRAPALLAALGLCAAACTVDEPLLESDAEVSSSSENCRVPSDDELAGWDPDESCPNLDAIIGAEAVATFERHRELREEGIDPDIAEHGDDAATGVAYAVTLRTIYGYVRDANGQPVAGVSVQAFDADDLDDDDFMGDGVTNAAGYYEIHYDGGHWDPCPHEWVCWRPDIYTVVSSSQWINHGKVYAGNWTGTRPMCANLEYAWQHVAGSSERTDWRLRDPLRIDVTTPPADEILQAPGDRPPCLTGPFCYSFFSLHSECFGVVERLQGCTTTGQQFEWFDACFFASSSSGLGMYGTYVGPISRCFAEPLAWPPASCTRGASLQPVDPQPTFIIAAALEFK